MSSGGTHAWTTSTSKKKRDNNYWLFWSIILLMFVFTCWFTRVTMQPNFFNYRTYLYRLNIQADNLLSIIIILTYSSSLYEFNITFMGGTLCTTYLQPTPTVCVPRRSVCLIHNWGIIILVYDIVSFGHRSPMVGTRRWTCQTSH